MNFAVGELQNFNFEFICNLVLLFFKRSSKKTNIFPFTSYVISYEHFHFNLINFAKAGAIHMLGVIIMVTQRISE